MKIPIEISAHHAHLSQTDFEKLFGAGRKLTRLKDISQPGQFLAKERIDLIGSKNVIQNVAIVGPTRNKTQIEISKTDSIFLGIPNTPIAISGKLTGSGGGITLKGAKGKIKINSGVIIAARHLHIAPDEASSLNLKDGDIISIKTEGERSLILNNVIVRSKQNQDTLALHIDTDEANAAGVQNGSYGTIVTI